MTDVSDEQVSKPGLFLLHGNLAHAHWWTHLAPFWKADFVVVSASLSGHGKSGWRQEYTFKGWAQEMAAVARHAGFVEDNGNVMVAHSVGVMVACCLDHFHNGSQGLYA